MAQKKYEGPGNWFVGMDVGSSMSMAENVTGNVFMKTRIPTGSIQIGRTLSPYFGIRLTAGSYSQIGYASAAAVRFGSDTYTPYQFHNAIGTLDLMLNLSNLFRRYDVRNWFDCHLIVGGGALYTFGFDEKVDEWDVEIYPVSSDNLLTWTGRVGLLGAWHVTRSWDLNTELDVHATDNAYNGVVDSAASKMDLFLSFRIGMTYFLRNGKGRHRYANPPIKHPYWSDVYQ